MSGEESDEREAEYAGWELPGHGDEQSPSDGEDGGTVTDADEKEPFGPPPMIQDQPVRDRIRDRLGVTPQQWYVLETLLLVLPYPLFVLVYITFPVNETLFLAVTLAYSPVAAYVGLFS